MLSLPTQVFSDATLKTTKQWREKKEASVVAGSEKVKRDLTSSPVFSDASEKTPHSGFSDATLKTKKQQRQKKGAPVVAGSEKVKKRDLISCVQ